MRTNTALRFASLLAGLSSLAACSAPRFDVIPRVQEAKLGGTIGATTTGMSVTSNDVANDLGLNQTESEFGARADLAFGAGKWTFAWSPASFSGNGTLNVDVTNGGVTIPAGTAVASDVKMNVGSAIWTFDFVPGDTVELGLGLGVHALDFSGTVTDGTDTVHLSKTLPVPVLAGRAGVAFGPFDVSALVSGLHVATGGDSATFMDTDLMGRWRFFGGVDGHLSGALVVGWHKTDVKIDYTDSSDQVNADLNVSGIYYGLSFGF